jgi:hypothetical protein
VSGRRPGCNVMWGPSLSIRTLTSRVRFEGKEDVAALHRDIFAVLEDIETTEPLALGDTQAFIFRAHVRGAELEVMNVVRVNAQGQIAEITIFGRPCQVLQRCSPRSRRGFRRDFVDL